MNNVTLCTRLLNTLYEQQARAAMRRSIQNAAAMLSNVPSVIDAGQASPEAGLAFMCNVVLNARHSV